MDYADSGHADDLGRREGAASDERVSTRAVIPGWVSGAAELGATMPSGLELRRLTDLDDLRSAIELFSVVWGTDPGDPPFTIDVLVALALSGNYLVGVYHGSTMVAASVGFFGPPSSRVLHSHVAAVLQEYRGRSIGLALKLHQRTWALECGVETVRWTFDPLVARNAYFNLEKLGATVTSYLVDAYGPMNDGINRADETDRLLISWPLSPSSSHGLLDRGGVSGREADEPAKHAAPILLVGKDQLPERRRVDSATRVALQVPEDIEQLRRVAPTAAQEWRSTFRVVIGEEVAAGGRIVRFDRQLGYIIDRRGPS